MKTVKVTTDNKISVIDVNLNDYRSITKAIGRSCELFETVRTQFMLHYFEGNMGDMIMMVDESGLLKRLPVNKLGSIFYGAPVHGYAIVGDIIFGVRSFEDIVVPEDAEALKKKLLEDFDFLEEEKE